MSGFKRYIVFAYDYCERGGGFKDIHCHSNSFEEAVLAAESDEARKNSDTVEIYDIEKEKVITSFYLTTIGEWLRDE